MLGVVRNTPARELPDASLINTDSSGPRCLSDDSVVLWRANAANPEQVTVTDAQGKVIASLAWPAGQSQLAAPKLAFDDGKNYQIQRDFQPVDLRIHKAPAQPENLTARIAWMARSGCNKQALSLLKKL